MPFMCFSYPDSPSAGTTGDAPAQPDLRMMPLMCFSYTADVPRICHIPASAIQPSGGQSLTCAGCLPARASVTDGGPTATRMPFPD